MKYMKTYITIIVIHEINNPRPPLFIEHSQFKYGTVVKTSCFLFQKILISLTL